MKVNVLLPIPTSTTKDMGVVNLIPRVTVGLFKETVGAARETNTRHVPVEPVRTTKELSQVGDL